MSEMSGVMASPNMLRNEEARAAVREMNDQDDVSSARIGPQLGYMQGLLSDTHSLITELSKKIEPILIPDDEMKVPSEVPSPPRKPSSEMSNSIDDLNNQINRLQRRISAIIERVQL